MKRKRFGVAILSLLASSSVILQGTAVNAHAQTILAQGVGPGVAQNATVFGDTPSNTPVTVSVILTTRNSARLAQYISATTTPGNPQFRKFLTTSQFAQTYGQDPATVQQIVSYFKGYGISAYIYPNNLDITLNGTAGQFNQAFNVTLQDMSYHGKKFHGVKKSPTVPSQVGRSILAVLGLTNYSPFSSQAQRVPASVLAKMPKNSTAGTPPTGVYTPQQFTTHYGIDSLYKAGDYGQGETIGIVTLAALDPSDAPTFWQGYNIPNVKANRISVVNVDGGPGAPSEAAGSGETALDVEQSGLVAPQANIRVYQAPNTDYGFADAFFQAISDNQVDSLSTSWGESEDAISYSIGQGEESPNYAQVFNEIYMEAAAQGISTFASAGDSGAYDASGDLGTTDLSVDNPADSPYVTAAGGTTLPWSDIPGNFGNTVLGIPNSVVTTERAWGWDYLWPYYAAFGADSEADFAPTMVVGGGGGYSVLFRQPDFQAGVSGVSRYQAVPYLTPTENNTSWTFTPNPSVVSGQSNGGRAMPDVSMNADPFTGYNIYSSVFGSGADGWSSGWGGTSFVAPQLNGIATLIDEEVGGRVGEWNPQIYRFASQADSPFTPLDTAGTSNDNLYYTGTSGTLWNPATGLGYPDVSKLVKDFAESSVSQGAKLSGH